MSNESIRQAEETVTHIYRHMDPARYHNAKSEMTRIIAEALEKAWKQGFDDCEMSKRLDRIASLRDNMRKEF